MQQCCTDLSRLATMQIIDDATTVMWKGHVSKMYCSADVSSKTDTQTEGCYMLLVTES